MSNERNTILVLMHVQYHYKIWLQTPICAFCNWHLLLFVVVFDYKAPVGGFLNPRIRVCNLGMGTGRDHCFHGTGFGQPVSVDGINERGRCQTRIGDG